MSKRKKQVANEWEATVTDARKADCVLHLASILGQQTDFQEIIRIVALKTATLLAADFASIVLVNPATQNTLKTIIKEGNEPDRQKYRLAQTNVIGWVSKKKQAFLSADLQADSRFSRGVFEKEGVGSAMCVQIQCERITVGYLSAMRKDGKPAFGEETLDLLETMAAISAPFLTNAQKIHEYFNPPISETALVSKYRSAGLLGQSQQFVELLRAVEAAARCDVRVLLEGQSGTGKELIACAIHKFSSRKDEPFVPVDCGAIPENLIESELFGHVRGAFTGAMQNRIGLIEAADGGTLFMDEVSNLPFEMQSKLLRVLQEGEVRAVGSNSPRKVDVRIVAASSASLLEQVESRQFREDLFYRLHVYPIYVPTLNERQGDVALLANRFLYKFVRQQQKQAESFDGSILHFMRLRKWPGNVRELENFVERMVTLARPKMTVLGGDILPREFRKEFGRLAARQERHLPGSSLQESLAGYETQLIRQALADNDWNQRKAARALQISEGTIRYKIEKLGIAKT